jgi:hypothetical protein
LLFNYAVEYAIRTAQVNQDGLKLNGTHQLLVYADVVNILGGHIHTIKKNKVANMGGEERYIYRVLMGKREGKRPLVRHRHR